ncbi:hypothetical protein Tco_1423343, partial [Tanacetum coccineum]
MPTDVFVPEFNNNIVVSYCDVHLSSVLSDKVLYSWGDNEDVGRKVIVISSCLLEDIDSVTKIALLVCRCHGDQLDDERGNKLVKSTSCPVTGLIVGTPIVVVPSTSNELDDTDQAELNNQVFQGLCSALHYLDQGLVCSSRCNTETMRETSVECSG